MSYKPKSQRNDVHHTISLDKIASQQIKEMAADIGNNISATLRMIIREAYRTRQRDKEIGCM
jgi:hypothetical protein